VVTGVWSGVVATLPVNAAYVFAGPFTTVTTTATQRLTAAGTAVLAATADNFTRAEVGLCFQNNANPGVLTPFAVTASIPEFLWFRLPYSAASSVVPGAGTWRVGFCVRNTGVSSLNDNQVANGWVQVTN